MTLQECYVKIGGDYNDILHRFMNENMVRKFVLKFPQDNNMALFEESWAKKDYETAFRAMHTLKGVAVNLGFTALYNVSSALTEKLRSPSSRYCTVLAGLPTARPQMVTGTLPAFAASITIVISFFIA